MSREQALDLWVGTLSLRAVPPVADQTLHSLWEAAGLTADERQQLVDALRETDALARRRRLIGATRRLLTRRGWDVDRLSTPSASAVGW